MATTKLVVGAMYSGQGMCNVIESYDGAAVTKLMLADFGAEKDSGTARLYTLQTLLKKVNARGKIDVMVISHSDKDHWNLMSELLDGLAPSIKIDIAAFGLGHWLNAAKAFRDKVDKRLTNGPLSLKFFWSAHSDIGASSIAYWDLGWDGVTFNILAASVRVWDVNKSVSPFLTEPNTASIVLRCKFANNYVILTGDATWATLKFINTKMGGSSYTGTGFMVTAPHHGALATLNNSLGELETFVDSCTPECTLASAQMRDRFNHPNVCVMCTLAQDALKDGFPGGPHSMVINFPGDGLCDSNAIFKVLNALPKTNARSGYHWYEISSNYNIFTTLLSGSTATNWFFNIAASGTTSVTQGSLTLDFERDIIFETPQRAVPAAVSAVQDEDEFFVGMPPPGFAPPQSEPAPARRSRPARPVKIDLGDAP